MHTPVVSRPQHSTKWGAAARLIHFVNVQQRVGCFLSTGRFIALLQRQQRCVVVLVGQAAAGCLPIYTAP